VKLPFSVECVECDVGVSSFDEKCVVDVTRCRLQLATLRSVEQSIELLLRTFIITITTYSMKINISNLWKIMLVLKTVSSTKNELLAIECTKNQFYADQIHKFQQQHKKIQVNFLTTILSQLSYLHIFINLKCSREFKKNLSVFLLFTVCILFVGVLVIVVINDFARISLFLFALSLPRSCGSERIIFKPQ
jgi:hypothetical protein